MSLGADPTTEDSIQFANDLSAFVASQKWSDNYVLSVSGMASFLTLMQNSVERDLALMDGIVMPIALLVLAYVLRSLRLVIIPIVTLLVSALIAFSIIYITTFFVNVVFITPSLMMSMLVR